MGEITVFIPNEIPRLKELDALLRCGICYEYMKTSMITACSHNYCSLCIRKSLMYKAQCPTCFEEVSDNQLRNNRIVDDIIEIFGGLLDEVRSFMQEYGKFSDSRVKYNADNKGNVNNACSSQGETRAVKKLSECANGPAESSDLPKSKVELSDYNNFVRTQNMTPVKESHQSPDHRRQDYKGEVVIPAMFSPRKKHNVDEKFVSCPVCNVDIPEKNINVHLDACLKRSEIFDQHTSSTRAQKRKPLPKLVYRLIQDKKLREMLKQLGLSTHGDHKTLVNRHQRFTLLYNSENDNLNPRSTTDIIKQIEREEQEEKKLCAATTSAHKLKIDVKTDPKLIEQAQQQYRQNNKASFEKLIQSMRKQEAGKKTVVKRKLILSDEDDSEDKNKEVQVHKVSWQKRTMENPISTKDEDTVEKGSDLCEPCGSMSPIIEDVSDDEGTSDEMLDMNYKSDTDEAPSPVLGRNVVTNCSRMETEKSYEGELCDNLTLDMSVKIMSRPSAKKCIAAAQQSKDVETHENSSETETVIESSKENTAPAVDVKLSRGMPQGFNSQHYDPDSDSYSEGTSAFDFRASPVRKRRRNKRLSPQPSSSREGRSLRKKGKY